MALTELLNQPEVRSKLQEVCRLNRLNYRLAYQNFIRPQHKNYALVGKAFDYALRFWLEARQLDLTLSGAWIAEASLRLMKESDPVNQLINPRAADQELINWIEKCLDKARGAWRNYLKSTHQSNDNQFPDRSILRMSLFSGELDGYYRAHTFDENMLRSLLKAEVDDLAAMIQIVPSRAFRAQKQLILNPSFGESSESVGGADADLIIDDCLFDFKTAQRLEVKPDHIWQVICYRALAAQSGIYSALNQRELEVNPHQISWGAIYFARYGTIFKWKFETVIDDSDLFKLGKWLVDYGQMFYHGHQLTEDSTANSTVSVGLEAIDLMTKLKELR